MRLPVSGHKQVLGVILFIVMMVDLRRLVHMDSPVVLGAIGYYVTKFTEALVIRDTAARLHSSAVKVERVSPCSSADLRGESGWIWV